MLHKRVNMLCRGVYAYNLIRYVNSISLKYKIKTKKCGAQIFFKKKQ